MDDQLNKKNKLVGKALVMFVVMIISKILGFSRDILLTYKFGTSEIIDAYTVAITLPSVLFAVFVSGLSHTYLPYYTRCETNKKKQELFSNTIIIFSLLSMLVAFGCFFLRDWIASALAPGFDADRHDICVSFIGIVIWMFPFFVVFTLMSAQLQTKEDFNAANICDFLIVNIVIIISILLASPEKPYILVFGYVFSMILACIALGIYFIKHSGVRIIPNKDNALNDFIELIIISIPVGLSYMVNQINSVTDSVFSSTFSTGVTSGLNYANKLQSFFLSLTISVFMTIVFPRLNVFFAEKRFKDGLYYIKKGIAISSILSIPFAVFTGVFARDIVISLFQRGAFNANSTTITAGCLALYSIGIPFYAYVEIGSHTLTALLRQKMILKNTSIAVFFNIISDLVLMEILGYVGLSLATSFSGVLLFVLYFRDIRKIGLECFNREVVIEIGKIVMAALVALFPTFLYRSLSESTLGILLNTGISALVFGTFYLIACMVMKVSVLNWFVDVIGIKNRK